MAAAAAAAATAASIGVAGCASGSAAPLPPIPPTVTVTVHDHSVDEPAIPAGRVVFRILNRGRLYHTLALVPLPPNIPPLRQQLAGSKRVVVNPVANSYPLAPGSSTIFSADMSQGRWGLVDFSRDPQGVSFALEGVESEFRVR